MDGIHYCGLCKVSLNGNVAMVEHIIEKHSDMISMVFGKKKQPKGVV